jgi:hypothetical protein
MGLDVLHPIRPPDHAFGVDEVRDPARRRGVLLIGPATDLVSRSHGPVAVGEQLEGKLELLGEGPVGLRGVEGSPEDIGVEGLKLGGSITEPLCLQPSPGGVGLDEPPQHRPSSPEIVEGHGAAQVVGQLERRRDRPFFEHGGSLSRGTLVP